MQPTEPYFPESLDKNPAFRALLESLSDRLRSELSGDGFAPIEQLVAEAPPEYQATIFEQLVIEEAQLRMMRGAEPTLDEYLQRFPNRVTLVERAWRKLQSHAAPSTVDHQGDPSDANGTEHGAEPTTLVTSGSEPTHFGSYKVLRPLGSGTFGLVVKAQNESTGEVVAIKVLKSRWARDPDCGEAMRRQFAEEAKMMLQFDHPHVVRVISLDERAETPYLVQQYIDGETLGDRLQTKRLTLQQSLEYAIQIADGLAHIHSHECWHRDLKPANILLDRNNHLYLADFGLALDEAQRWSSKAGVAGTYPYMAPEQIKGATHRLNARCDIWALGVILYEMLTGRRPFRSQTREQLCDDVTQRTPPTPRELNQSIPRELNRLCMQCLSKRDADRPHAAADVRDDLAQILKAVTEASSPMGAAAAATQATEPDNRAAAESSVEYPIPTLKRFTAEQAELYLRLMPRGYATAEELPELITFWKSRIIENDPDQTFAVGIMVGVSGCGKSSMLEAGLVPALPESVIPILIEASETDTEVRILNKLRRALPDADPDKKWSLVDWTFRLRSGNVLPQGKKVVFVLDQFEQWLNAHGGEPTNQLLDALHQCDGEHLQAIVCVREGFHATLMRFVEALDLNLDDQHNYATAHRFTPDHARFVLSQFGRGLKRVDNPPTVQQQAFIDATVDALAESDRGVVCVRLVVLALVMQDRPWSTEELKQLGGLDGIGSQFLVDCFEGRTASEQYRRYLPAAMRVLAELLPVQGLEIKDVRSYEQLLAASELDKRQFDDLLGILVRKLFLLTPVEQITVLPSSLSSSSSSSSSSPTTHHAPPATSSSSTLYYQLTHDFLVPSIRDWLSRKLRETKAGRAQLRLQELTTAWTTKPQNRNLPSLWEWINIRRLTDSKKWKASEQTVMRRAGRVHAGRGFLTCGVLAALVTGGLWLNRTINERQLDLAASKQVEALTQADIGNVSRILEDLAPLRLRATDKLKAAFAAESPGTDGQLKAALGLMDKEPAMLEIVSERLLDVPSAKFIPIRNLVQPHKESLLAGYWQVAGDAQQPAPRRFQAACVLATYDPEAKRWTESQFTTFLANHLVGVLPSDLPVWQQALLPVREKLVPGLAAIFRDSTRREQERSFATDTLKTYAAGDAAVLVSLICDADTDGFTTLFPVLADAGPEATTSLNSVIKQRLTHDWQDRPLDPTWQSASASTKAKLETHAGLLAERFAWVQTLAWEDFTELAEELKKCGYRPTRVRPYQHDGSTLVAALWQRDGGRWELQANLGLADLPDPQQPATRDGLVPYDLSVQYVDDAGVPRFCLLWGETQDATEQRRVLADLKASQFSEFNASTGFYTSPVEGFPAQSTVTVWADADGVRHYAGIWSNQGAVSEVNLGFDGEEYFDQPQWDIALGVEPQVVNPLVSQRALLKQIDSGPPEIRESVGAKVTRATALFHLGELDSCEEQLRELMAVEATAQDSDLQRLFAWTLARLSQADAAREALAKHLEKQTDPVMRAYASAPVEAYLGNLDAASQQLADARQAAGGNADALYSVVCAAALSALPGKVNSAGDRSEAPPDDADAEKRDEAVGAPTQASVEPALELALELLQATIEAGYNNGPHLSTDVDLAVLHSKPRFQELVRRLLPSQRIVGLWRSDVEVESRLVQAESAEALLEQSRSLLELGYRPVSLSVDPQAALLVLHRPLIPDAQKEHLAIRQASASAALLRLGQAEEVWPLFKHAPDLRARSYLLSRLTGSQVDAEMLLEHMRVTLDPASRHALILAVGQYAAADLLLPEQRSSALQWLKTAYADDPDPGVHGACEWALRQLNAGDVIDEIRSAYATGQPVGERRWYQTKTLAPSEQTDPTESQKVQPLVLTLVDGRQPFLMGSAVSEAERFGGPTGKNEIRHLRTIGYQYAIGMHEVSVAQFKQFRPRHDFNRQFARESDAPANMISWYDAAAYCNWLSEQEGIPREQWCYDPDQPFAEGMVLPQKHLQRAGYRLPTEAEWEYACRASTETARFFGETDRLLGEYGWYTKNSDDRFMLATGSQKPNPLGLFGIYGNAFEWCFDSAKFYEKTSQGNLPSLGKVGNSGGRVLRGGSFDNSASNLRSGSRNYYRPASRSLFDGFRVSRTLPLIP